MKRNLLNALIIMLVAVGASSIAHALCKDSTTGWQCLNAQGCAGMRWCAGGHLTPCIVNPVTCQTTGSDLFTAANAPGNTQVGICVDGRNGIGTEVNDLSFVLQGTAPSTTFDVGNLRSSSLANEVVSFAVGRAPTWAPTPWTGSNDQFFSSMAATMRVAITIWIVTAPGTAAVQAGQAVSTAIQAGALFDQERVGLDWSVIEVRDSTTDPDAPAFQNVAANFGQLETLIGHVNGRINIYWVPMVNGGTGNGLGEVANGDSVAVGQNAAPGLLAHEIGHCLALDHVDGDSRFNGTNVMMSNNGGRRFFTEGQAFRAHIRSISAIRSVQVYSLRQGMPVRDNCNLTTTDRLCPKADKRIWADGLGFPPN